MGSSKRPKWPAARVGAVALLAIPSFGAHAATCLARVDTQCIQPQDVQYRQQVGAAYGRHSDDVVILAALINDAIDEAIAQRLGIAASAQEVDSLAQHADDTSRNPAMLKQVKAVFADDTSSYRRIYLRPKITAHKLHSYQSRKRDLHAKETQLIEAAYSLVATGTNCAEAAERLQLSYHESTPRKEPEALPSTMRQFGFEAQDVPADPIAALVANLQPGALYPQIVETDQAFLVVRLLSKDDSGVRYESIAAAKRPYEDWLHDAGKEVSVQIADPEVRAAIHSRYAQIWWVQERLRPEDP